MSGFAGNVADPKIEKHTLIILRPRARVTGWVFVSGTVYRAPFSYGYVNRAWKLYDTANGLTLDTSSSLSDTEHYYYDRAAGYIYVSNDDGFGTPVNPDAEAYPGITIEFELNISDQTFIGPRDPMDAASEHVNWVGALRTSPLAQIGSRDSLYGFLPLNSSVLQILNDDGWMNPFLYDASFYRGTVKAFILANENLYNGVVFSEVKQVFLGFCTGMKASGGIVAVACTDFISFFDKQIPLRRITDTTYTNLMPEAQRANNEWLIPRVWGIHDSYEPIPVDYNATPSTSNNRDYITHDRDFDLAGAGQDDGTLSYNVDFLAANTTTRTYFTTTPLVRVGDSMIIQRSGVDKYVFIDAVNRAAKYVDHTSDAIAGAAAPGDTADRLFVAVVYLQDSIGNSYTLKGGRDYSLIVDNTNNVRGFTLNDNIEASLLDSPFDPATWKISCKLYGRRSLDKYEDTTDVGAVVENGGIAGKSIQALYRLLVDAGAAQGDISDSFFQSIQDDSYCIGLAIPDTRSTTLEPTYRDVINTLLLSNLYKVSIIDESSELKLGVVQVQPFPGAGDFSADELNHKGFDFEHDYANLASLVQITYGHHDLERHIDDVLNYSVVAASPVASSLHFVKKAVTVESLIVETVDAQELANRFAFLLGERRGYWNFDFELPYVDKTNIGSTYRISKQFMPGFTLVQGTLRERELLVAEVNKNSRGVNITFDDQKGVQDNSGNW